MRRHSSPRRRQPVQRRRGIPSVLIACGLLVGVVVVAFQQSSAATPAPSSASTTRGAKGPAIVKVPDEVGTYLVATRQPDGRVTFSHTTGEPTRAQLTAWAKAKETERKEARDVR